MHKDFPVQFGVSLRVQTPKGLSGGFSGWLSFWFVFQYTYVLLVWFYFPQRCIQQCCKQAHADWKRTERWASRFISPPSPSVLLLCLFSGSQSGWDNGVLPVRLSVYLPAPIHLTAPPPPSPPCPTVSLSRGWGALNTRQCSKEFQKRGRKFLKGLITHKVPHFVCSRVCFYFLFFAGWGGMRRGGEGGGQQKNRLKTLWFFFFIALVVGGWLCKVTRSPVCPREKS